MVKKVVIIGAGASGLLLAHYLLKRGYEVDIYERHGDPRSLAESKSRTFPIAVDDRGMNSLGQIPGLTDEIEAVGHEIVASVSHSSTGKPRVIPRTKPLTTIDRLGLVKVLLNSLEAKNCERLKINFQHSCTRVDLTAKQAYFTTSSGNLTIDYDLVIGADGARSVVRKAFLDTPLFEYQQKYVSDDYKSLFLPAKDIKHQHGARTCGSRMRLCLASYADAGSPHQLDTDKIHTWRTDNGIVIILVPQSDGSLSGVIHFPRSDRQISKLSSTKEVLEFFQHNFPAVAELMSDRDAEAFLARPIASNLTVRCNRYHHNDSALLIGDAAHAMSPALGQGCNCALEDVSVLNGLLAEYADNWSQVLAQFTARRLPDTLAIVELSDYSLPVQKSLFVELILRIRIAGVLHKLFPKQFLPPLIQAIHDPAISYSQIYEQYRGWCNKVKKSKLAAKF